MARCSNCYVVLYGDYGEDGTWDTFVRAGTLDDESKKTVRPDAHIFTSTKMDWVDLTGEEERGVPVLEGRYRMRDVWRKDAVERYDAMTKQRNETKQADEGVDWRIEKSKMLNTCS